MAKGNSANARRKSRGIVFIVAAIVIIAAGIWLYASGRLNSSADRAWGTPVRTLPGAQTKSFLSSEGYSVYSFGTVIGISAINISNKSVATNTSWKIINSDGATVATFGASQETVKAGDRKYWTWDQKDARKQQVPAGNYTVIFTDPKVNIPSYRFAIYPYDGAHFKELFTDLQAYGKDATVRITIAPTTYRYDWSGCGWKVVNEAGSTVFAPTKCNVVGAVWYANVARQWTWDQKDANGKLVPAGKYKIVFEATATTEGQLTPGTTRTVTSDLFRILP